MQSDPALHTALQTVGTPNNAFDIAYHMWWPSPTDPFWLANQPDNQARQQYYAVSGTPTQKCDGSTTIPNPTQLVNILNAINARLPVASPLLMDLNATVNGTNLNVTATVTANTTIANGHVIQFALLDRYSNLPNSPNGQPNHYHAMLDMAPTASGQTFTCEAGGTVQYSALFALSPSWQLSNLDIAAFVQYNATKEILQSRCERVPVNFPGLQYQSYTLQDNGNNDGRAEPGETASMFVTLANQPTYQPATNVVGTLTTTDPTLTITTPTVNFPNIPNGGTGTNSSPFVFQVSSSATPHPATVHLHVVADPQQTPMDADISLYIGWPDVLLIDDDGGAGTTMETYYFSTLQALNQPYEYWDIATQGVPTLTLVSHYTCAIWFTAYVMDNVLTTAEQTLIQGYLNQGGFLFINGQNLAWGLSTYAPTFLSNVLHASYLTYNTNIHILNGVAGNPVGNGMILNINSGGSGSGSATAPDGIGVLAPAQIAFEYQGSATYKGGLTYVDGVTGHKLVYFSFPFEAVNGLPGSNSREQELAAIFNYFGITTSNPNVTLDIVPTGGTSIPPGGGPLPYSATLTNNESTPLPFDYWCNYSQGTTVVAAFGPITRTSPAGPGYNINRALTQTVPGSLPAGSWNYNALVGDYPTVWANDFFAFTKSAVADGGAFYAESKLTGWDDEEAALNSTGPNAYRLVGAYPNPFNPSTVLSYELQVASFVKLSVYDLAGHEVAQLVNGWREAGLQGAAFDGSKLASGIYIYRLSAGEFAASGKMVLMK